MIAIVNVGPHDPKAPMGWRTYEVRINHDVIARFRHKRADGLGKCLMEASKAIERQKWGDIDRILGECRHDAGHDLNGVGMWICKCCRADITPESLENATAQTPPDSGTKNHE